MNLEAAPSEEGELRCGVNLEAALGGGGGWKVGLYTPSAEGELRCGVNLAGWLEVSLESTWLGYRELSQGKCKHTVKTKLN